MNTLRDYLMQKKRLGATQQFSALPRSQKSSQVAPSLHPSVHSDQYTPELFLIKRNPNLGQRVVSEWSGNRNFDESSPRAARIDRKSHSRKHESHICWRGNRTSVTCLQLFSMECKRRLMVSR